MPQATAGGARMGTDLTDGLSAEDLKEDSMAVEIKGKGSIIENIVTNTSNLQLRRNLKILK